MFSQTRLVWIMLILRPAIFLDRDGVINVDHGYPHKLEHFAFMPDAETAIKRAHHKNIPIFIVTNQGGIGLGYFDITAMRQFHDHMLAQIADAGGHITDIAYCPHHPKSPDPVMRDCDCRKPKPGMILDLARRHQIDVSKSIMIGDRATDMEAASAAGCQGFLYQGGSLLTVMDSAMQHIANVAKTIS